MKRFVLRWEAALVGLLVLEFIVFGAINPRFLNPSNLLYGTSDFVHIGIIALPLTLVIISGGIDVSFASLVGLCAIVFGVANFFGVPLPLAIAMALAAGVLAGAFNAAIIHFSRIQPLVVTLGSLYLFGGAATVLSGAVGAGGYEGIGNFPAAFTSFGYLEIFGVPAILILFLMLAALFAVLLHLTRFGRAVYLVGQSPDASRYSGLPVGRVQAATYLLTGLCAAIAGLVLSSYFGSARVDLGTATLLPAITAVVLGGASIYGGQGSLVGTILAVFVIGFLQQGLQMAGVPSQVSSALSGGLLVVVVALRHGSAMLPNLIAAGQKAMTARPRRFVEEKTND
ncbi:autoinducer 2 import system permease LsrD [Arsenicitalea aurantiaca]|uniref:Autoinducer 2 import system permease protein LsrD n=1 Tax=Arsenicitalea aurantiaca TaxID=1783274 RepID=A0A433X465_9HYPH|nr:autoinducer 2 import system permease LsrD [Arsenicitalea aurantiaca]RUT28854.1 autoinducer 2 import system permease LsrD [Arsenicitalea aurantiaca]